MGLLQETPQQFSVLWFDRMNSWIHTLLGCSARVGPCYMPAAAPMRKKLRHFMNALEPFGVGLDATPSEMTLFVKKSYVKSAPQSNQGSFFTLSNCTA